MIPCTAETRPSLPTLLSSHLIHVTSHNQRDSYPSQLHFRGEKSRKYGWFGWLLRWRPSLQEPFRGTFSTTLTNCDHTYPNHLLAHMVTRVHESSSKITGICTSSNPWQWISVPVQHSSSIPYLTNTSVAAVRTSGFRLSVFRLHSVF